MEIKINIIIICIAFLAERHACPGMFQLSTGHKQFELFGCYLALNLKFLQKSNWNLICMENTMDDFAEQKQLLNRLIKEMENSAVFGEMVAGNCIIPVTSTQDGEIAFYTSKDLASFAIQEMSHFYFNRMWLHF